MTRINVSDLKPDMVLAEPVYNYSGNLLVKDGVALNDKSINVLKKWGILEVMVKGVEQKEVERSFDDQVSEAEIQKMEKKIWERFIFSRDDPIMKEIIRITKKIKLQELLSKKNDGE